MHRIGDLLHSPGPVQMQLDDRPIANPRVLSQRAADTVVLLDPDSGEYFSLDEVGGRVWDLCDGSRTVAGISEAIAEDFDAPAEEIERDVLELLTELASLGLVSADG